MALAIDGSTPAVATQTTGSNHDVTSPSFTPPSGSILVNLWAGNTGTSDTPATPTITDNLGAHLTYSLQDWKSRADSPARDGQAADWTAPVGTGAAMTVTATNGTATANAQAALQVVVVTGQDSVTPVGQHGKSGSASTSTVTISYTATVTGSQGFVAITDWDDKGAMTGGSNATIISSASIPGQISYGFARQSTAGGVAGVTTSFTVNLGAASTNVSWVFVEILPPAAA